MPLFENFVGGFYKSLSATQSADTAINLYTETRTVPGGAKQVTMYGTPGRLLNAMVSSIVCRGGFALDGREWTVIGDQLYERSGISTYTSLGTIANDGLPVFFASNGPGGEQLAIVGGGELKILALTTSILSDPIDLPFSNPVMIVFLDGYFLINEKDTPKVWFSALEDGTSWDSLDVFIRSNTPDAVIGLAVTKDRIWTIGSQTTLLYYDSGDVDNPFQPYSGTTMLTGAVTAYGIQVYNDVAYWLAVSPSGQARIVSASDAQTNTISTPPIDAFLARCTRLTDAESMVYEQEGHAFYILTCPSATDDVETYAYDAREQLWHARADFDEDTGNWLRWNARGCWTDGQQVFVGDATNGNIYTLDLNTYDNNGDLLVAERTAPYSGTDDQWQFIDQFELGTAPGNGLANGQGSDPVAQLWVSRDAAQTWISAGTASLGKMGEFLTRVIWRRLGRVRMDRFVMRVRISDPVKRVLGPGAWIRATAGTGEL